MHTQTHTSGDQRVDSFVMNNFALRNGGIRAVPENCPKASQPDAVTRLVSGWCRWRGVTGLLLFLFVAGCSQDRPADPAPSAGSVTSITSAVASLEDDASRTQPVRREPLPDDWFEDVTPVTSIEFSSQNGREAERFTILETVGSGIGLFDFDCDGDADLFCAGGGRIDRDTIQPGGMSCGLFRNEGNWRFSSCGTSARTSRETDYSHGVLVADVNADGFPDVFVTCYGRNCLMLNSGDGTFHDATVSSALTITGWSAAAATGDVDGDGLLDLFVARYVDWKPDPAEICRYGAEQIPDVCPPQNYAPAADLLFLNLGDGRFQEAGSRFGVRSDGKGLGVIASELTRDSRVDFYIANDQVANHLYLSAPDSLLVEQGDVSGTAYNESGTPEGSMGVDAEDVDGDGWIDLWVTNFELEDNSLYQNLGNGQFQHATAAFGLAGRGRGSVGFGTGFVDFNSDGWPDLYVLNGHVWYRHGLQSFRQAPSLFQSHQGQRFEDVSVVGGPWFSTTHAARGGAVSDLDTDGAPDLVISSLDEPVTVLRNRKPAANWIRLKLIGTAAPRDPVGARVTLTAFDRSCVRILKSGAGYLSQSDSRMLFALDRDQATVELTIDWPMMHSERFTGLQAGQDHVLVQGRGQTIDTPDAPAASR